MFRWLVTRTYSAGSSTAGNTARRQRRAPVDHRGGHGPTPPQGKQARQHRTRVNVPGVRVLLTFRPGLNETDRRPARWGLGVWGAVLRNCAASVAFMAGGRNPPEANMFFPTFHLEFAVLESLKLL
eukprot:5205513-Prymnesium_polylepis.1